MQFQPRPIRRLISVMSVTVVAALALGALNVASAAATPYHWKVCKSVGIGLGSYSDAYCTKGEPGGRFEWVSLAEGTKRTAQSYNNQGPINLYQTAGGVTKKIECNDPTHMGSIVIENPVGGGAGTLTDSGGHLLELTGCKYITPSYCSVSEGKITSAPVSGTSSESAFAFKATSGENLFHAVTPGCSPENVGISGTLNGQFNNSNSALLFTTATSGKELKNSGATTSLEGSIQIRVEGKLIRFAS